MDINKYYDPKCEFDLDKMDELGMRWCDVCGYWINIDTEWEDEVDKCVYCAENDDSYQSYKKKIEAYDRYIDSRIDEMRGK